MVSQSAHNLPKTTVLCGSTWMHPATQGPSLHRVWHPIKALHPASATSSRSTTATTAAQEPVSSPGPPTVIGAGNWLDAKLPASSRTASARCQDSQRCQSPMPAPGLVSLEILQTQFLPDMQRPSRVDPASLQSATVNWTTRGGDNYSRLLEFGKDGAV